MNNNRIVAFITKMEAKTIRQLEKKQQKHKTTKTIVYFKGEKCKPFIDNGFKKEGQISGYYNGVKASMLAKYYDNNRSITHSDESNLQTVLEKKISKSPIDIPKEYTIESLKLDDVSSLVSLYKKVFERYPSNIFDESYLQESINDDYFFIVAKYEGEIVSAASALINPFKSAEITDCATDPTHRGKQLLTAIINELEKTLRQKGIYHSYSLTRALSIGMNMTIKRMGYTYEGTLINNCEISTGYEDMNIWTKHHK